MKCEKKDWDDLVVKIAGNDRDAFENLYEQFKSQVYGLAMAILKNRFDAEDVMQNVFVQVWDNAPKYRPGSNAGAWIMKITRNASMDKFRRQKKMTDIMQCDDNLISADEISPTLDKLLLHHLLTSLDCEERQIVILYIVGGYSHKEIAGIVGRPYATVRWKYSNAIKELQKIFDKEDSYERETQLTANS